LETMQKLSLFALALLAICLTTIKTNVTYKCKCDTAAGNGNYCMDWTCDPDGASCFSEDSLITLSSKSQKKIGDLISGDKLLTLDPKTKRVSETEFLDFIHLKTDLPQEFLKFTLDNGQTLEATADHLLHTTENGYTLANKISKGDTMDTIDSNFAHEFAKVLTIEKILKSGVYAPYTIDGGFFVNGIYVSSFARMELFETTKAFFWPWRVMRNIPGLKGLAEARTADGVLYYMDFWDQLIYKWFGGAGAVIVDKFLKPLL
jgi:hypothetical protein